MSMRMQDADMEIKHVQNRKSKRSDGLKTRAGRRGRYSDVKMTGRRGIFCRARSPGGRALSRKNCEKNPANCAAAVVSRARSRFSMGGVACSAGRAFQEVGQEA